MSQSGCKAYRAPVGSERAPSPDCIEYRLEDGHTLLLKHVNAAFNCCPGDITADIRIHERHDHESSSEESQPGCHCLCLYDLDYRFENIEAGTYTIVFIEPYRSEADEPLIATIDLSGLPLGQFCVERTTYPWSSGSGAGPYGVLVSRTDCDSQARPRRRSPPFPATCRAPMGILGRRSILASTHVNAAFNCCPGDITADIRIQNDTITIVEHESQSMCDCSCLYTLRFEIRNLEPGAYTIRFVEPYAVPGDEPLHFAADLAALPQGIVCAYRRHYPWGYQGTMEEDGAKLDAMRKAIVSLIGTASCGGDGDCRYIGLGAKPCGGVWEYLVYSAATVDKELLKYLVSRYNAFNEGFNRRYQIVSDCMFVMPPTVGCVGGSMPRPRNGAVILSPFAPRPQADSNIIYYSSICYAGAASFLVDSTGQILHI